MADSDENVKERTLGGRKNESCSTIVTILWANGEGSGNCPRPDLVFLCKYQAEQPQATIGVLGRARALSGVEFVAPDTVQYSSKHSQSVVDKTSAEIDWAIMRYP